MLGLTTCLAILVLVDSTTTGRVTRRSYGNPFVRSDVPTNRDNVSEVDACNRYVDGLIREANTRHDLDILRPSEIELSLNSMVPGKVRLFNRTISGVSNLSRNGNCRIVRARDISVPLLVRDVRFNMMADVQQGDIAREQYEVIGEAQSIPARMNLLVEEDTRLPRVKYLWVSKHVDVMVTSPDSTTAFTDPLFNWMIRTLEPFWRKSLTGLLRKHLEEHLAKAVHEKSEPIF